MRRGHRVRVADALITGKRANLDHLSGVEFLEGDLADLAFARQAVEGVEFVLHQAAIPSVPRSVADPLTSHRSNVDGTLNVLLAARDAGVRRVVFAASSSAYGNTPTLPKHEDDAHRSALAVRAPEGRRRAVPADVHRALRPRDRQPPLLQRVRSAAGPLSPYSGVISVFATALLDGRAPTIYGDGEQTRDFTYVADVVDGVLRACEAPGASGEVINVAAGGRISLNLLFDTMRTPVGSRSRRSMRPRARGDVRDSQADITKARRLLGFEPKVSLEEGLRLTVDWYRTLRGAAATSS